MHLSSIYSRTFWVLIYHTRPGSEEVELITNKFFLSKEKALKWFARKRTPSDFVEPEAVILTGLNAVSVQRDIPNYKVGVISTPVKGSSIPLRRPYDPLDYEDESTSLKKDGEYIPHTLWDADFAGNKGH